MAQKRKAIVELLADDRRFSKSLRRAQSRFKRFGGALRGTFRKAFSGLSTFGGLGAGFGLAGIGRQVLDFEDRLQRVGSQARLSRSELNNFREQITDLSRDTGLSRQELVAGIDEIVNLQGGSALTAQNLNTMSTALLGTGSAASEVAGLMFSLSENLGVTEEGMKGALAVIDRIGAEKSIPFKQLAVELAALSGEAKEFGAVGVEGAAKLVATMQALRTRFKGTAEVATGIKGAFTAFLRKESDFRKFGVRIRDRNGELRTFLDIVGQIKRSKLGENSSKLIEVMGRAEGFRAVDETLKKFEEIQRLSRLGLSNQGFLDTRAQERLTSTPGRIAKQWNDVKLTIAEVFTPDRLRKFADVLDKIATLLQKAFDNPGKTLALLAGLKFGPGILSTALPLGLKGAGALAGGSFLGQGLGGAAGALGGGALGAFKGAGLITLAGGLGVAFGQLLDRSLGLSDALSEAAVSLFGGGDVPRADANTLAGIERQQAAGDISAQEAEQRRARLRRSFEFSGVNSLVGALGNKIAAKTDLTKEQLAKRVRGNEDVITLAREILRADTRGEDVADEIRKLQRLIAGRPVEVSVDGEVLVRAAQNAITERLR